MAEEIKIDAEKLEELTAAAENFGSSVQSANLQLEHTSGILGSMSSGVFDSLGKSASISRKDIERLHNDVEKLKKGAKGITFDMDPLGDLMKNVRPADVRDAIGNAMTDAAKMVKQAFLSMEQLAKNTTQAVAAIGTIGLAKAKVAAIEFLNTKTGYIDLEKQLMGIQKSALQMGMAFGESYSEAGGSIGFFESSMADTIKTMKATEEELKATRGAMKEAFASREMFDNIEGLDGSLQGVKSTMNLTNIALAVSKATGMDVADVAGKMADMHLRLGTSLKDTALAFGQIRAVAKDSGLTYKTVSDTVIDSAKTLKFYGATVESVSPIFKAFNQSLKGIGKEGLTPELLKDFVGGLQQMSFNTRALLGLRMPGAGAGGAGILGGGLRVEQAMETGEGMGDVIKSLTDTMKQFGGQRLLTRQEAIDSPSAERNFIIQRQILGQLTGIKDSGKQNQMMQILQDMDKHGIEASTGAEEKLSELMASGEKTAEETTDSLTKAQLEYQRTRMTQGQQMIEQLKLLATESGIRDILRTSSDIIDAVTGSIGEVNFDAVEKAITKFDEKQTEVATAKLTEKQTQAAAIVKDESLQERYRKTAGKEMQTAVATKTMLGIQAEYKRGVLSEVRGAKEGSRARETFRTEGIATQDIHGRALAAAKQSVEARMKEITGLVEKPTTSEAEKRTLNIEMAGIKQALKQIGSGKSLRTRDRPAGDDVRSIEDYRKRQQERDIMLGAQPKAAGSMFSYENVQKRLGRTQETTPEDVIRLAEEKRKQMSDTAIPITTEEDRRQRARTGLAPTVTAKPVPGAPSRMHEIAPAKQELGGEITIKIQVDQDGRLVTEDKLATIVDGKITEELGNASKGVGKHNH